MITHKKTFLFYYLVLFTFCCSISPAYSGIVVVNGLSHIKTVIPGGTYKGVIEIQNNSDDNQEVRIYQKDYSFNSEGETFYNEPGSQLRSNAGWIDFSPAFINLRGKEKATIAYEVKIPLNDLFGTYWSVIMVEGLPEAKKETQSKGLQIQSQLRYAVQIATTVENEGVKNLTFLKATAEKGPSNRFVTVDIINPAEYLLIPTVSVELFDEKGTSLGTFTGEKRKMYPATSARFTMDVGNIPSGKYFGLFIADCGDDNLYGINLPVNISD